MTGRLAGSSRAPVAPPDVGTAAPRAVTGATHPRTGRDLVADHFADTAARAPSRARRVGQHLCAYVVLVPDPVDSRLDWLFDATVESVRRAFEAPGFVLERFWLPWTLAADSALRQRNPGVLLFRQASPAESLWRAPADTDLAVVYLVPETPTVGVRAEALRAALADRDTLRRDFAPCAGDPDSTRDELRVIGPAFSGSIESLRRGVGEWLAGGATRHATIVSGGATAKGNRKLMTRGTDRITYSATIHPVNALISTACTVVLDRRLGVSPGEVALLVEGSTAFGRSAAAVDSGLNVRAPPTDADPAGEAGATCRSLLTVPFPMSISRLRREYARHPASEPPAPMEGPGLTATPRVPLDLQDPASAVENPPALSDLTAPALERVMDDIAQTLLAHRVRVAIIVATDVRDRLFVADEVKRRLRDVRLVIVGSHTLFQRPEFNAELRGALVVSTYPLFVENQFWTVQRATDRNRIVFTNELSEGAYNATLVQLAPLVGHLQGGGGPSVAAGCAGLHGVALTDYRPPFAALPADPADTAGAHAARRPPVWLTVIGRTTIAPVTMFPMSDHTLAESDSTRLALGCGLTRGDVAESAATNVTAWELLALHAGALAGVALLLLALMGGPGDRATPPPAPPGGAPAPAVIARGPHSVARASTRNAALHLRTASAVRPLAFVAAVTPLFLVAFRASGHGWRPAAPVVGGFALTIYALLAALLASTRRTLRRHPLAGPPTPGALAECLTVAALAAAYVVATLVFLWRVTTLPAPLAASFYTRALQLGSGVSPVTPLVIGGVFVLLWAHQHVHRAALLGSEYAYEAHAIHCASRVRSALLGTASGVAARAAFAALALLVAWLASRLGRSLEAIVPYTGLAFDVLHRGLLLLLVVLTAWTAYRFLAVWVALHAELRVLGRAAYVEAFARLPRPLGGLARLTPIDRLPQREADWMVNELVETRVASLRAPRRPGPVDPGGRPTSPWDALLGPGAPAALCSRIPDADDDANGRAAARLLKWLRHERAVTPSPAPETLRTLEEVGALLAVDYVGWVIRHLRRLALQILAAVMLTTLFLSSYPVEPESVVRLVFFVIGGASIALLVAVLVAANRDPVLSRVANTDPGQLTWDAPFIVNLLAVSAVPILTVLGSEFPEVRDFLFGWLAPLLKTVGHG